MKRKLGHAARARVVNALQDNLENIYGVRTLRAANFLVDRSRLIELRGAERAPEELLLLERPRGLDIGLYIATDVLDRLAEPGPWTASRLSAHCIAAEGVSHFIYVASRATIGRPVSQLELEAQAEVDKYASVLFDLWAHGQRHASPELRAELFHHAQYRPHLDGTQRERYRLANLLASAYARFIETRYVLAGAFEALLRELRRLWRLGASEKLSHLARPLALG